jgi:hypothetical protein
VGVLEPGGRADLAEEALGPEGGRELGVENLECHWPVVPEVVGKVHGRHAAPAELALDPVAVSQGCLKAAGDVGQ